MIIVYGIPNCNTVKKALDWLKAHDIAFAFHDYKKQGITAEKLEQWQEAVGVEQLVNTKGTTWRGLTEAEKASATQGEGALQLMKEKTSLIRRPLIERDGVVIALGFDEPAYQKAFAR